MWQIIINPSAGNGKADKQWKTIEAALIKANITFNVHRSERALHCTKIAKSLIEQGVRNLIGIGGDGTNHEIINGLMLQKAVPTNEVTYGFIPVGTGNDWVKTHGISNLFEQAIQVIKNRNLKTQDVGKMTLESKNPSYFINLAGIGFDGFVVSKVNKYKHLGAVSYLAGALLGVFSFKNFKSKVSVNSKIIESKTLMILVGICKYSGGGMQLTQTPNPFDGFLDISVVKNIGKFDIIKNVVNLFNGKITNHKKVETLKSTSINIEITDKIKPYIQADGELIGVGNIEISIVPKAFSFYC